MRHVDDSFMGMFSKGDLDYIEETFLSKAMYPNIFSLLVFTHDN